jgi:hypothetical protein
MDLASEVNGVTNGWKDRSATLQYALLRPLDRAHHAVGALSALRDASAPDEVVAVAFAYAKDCIAAASAAVRAES